MKELWWKCNHVANQIIAILIKKKCRKNRVKTMVDPIRKYSVKHRMEEHKFIQHFSFNNPERNSEHIILWRKKNYK